MPRRASRWVLHDEGSKWSLSRGGRFLYQDLGSKAEAVKRMKAHYRPGEPVILEEKDGYRTNITDQLKRSGLI